MAYAINDPLVTCHITGRVAHALRTTLLDSGDPGPEHRLAGPTLSGTEHVQPAAHADRHRGTQSDAHVLFLAVIQSVIIRFCVPSQGR